MNNKTPTNYNKKSLFAGSFFVVQVKNAAVKINFKFPVSFKLFCIIA